MISAVAGANADPLDRVTGTVQLAEELGDVADSLIGHFVERARRGGASWSQIGRSMGMGKQPSSSTLSPAATTEADSLDPSQGSSRQ